MTVTPARTAAVDKARALVADAKAITVLTGAGISTDSRIPDYRGPDGVWTKNPGAEKTATIQTYVGDPEVRQRAWRHRLDSPVWQAEPNGGHEALLHLEKTGQLDTLVTQNIDGLHHRAGSSPDRIVEIHGSVREVVCLGCDYVAPMQIALDRVRAGEVDPSCPECDGLLKSSTISFGQSLVRRDLLRAQEAAERCDLLLAIGSTLSVSPINQMIPIAYQSNARIVILNLSATEMDPLADVVVAESISEALPIIVGAR